MPCCQCICRMFCLRGDISCWDLHATAVALLVSTMLDNIAWRITTFGFQRFWSRLWINIEPRTSTSTGTMRHARDFSFYHVTTSTSRNSIPHLLARSQTKHEYILNSSNKRNDARFVLNANHHHQHWHPTTIILHSTVAAGNGLSLFLVVTTLPWMFVLHARKSTRIIVNKVRTIWYSLRGDYSAPQLRGRVILPPKNNRMKRSHIAMNYEYGTVRTHSPTTNSWGKRQLWGFRPFFLC